jgi:DNA-binding response OmpR family regulator
VAIADSQVARAVVSSLGPMLHTPRIVGTGLRALSECIRRTPELLVAGVDLPGMRGLDLLRVLRERSTLARVPVVLVGTQLTDEERLTAFRAGADEVILWPVAEAELSARVDRVLARADSQGFGDRRALRGELAQVSLASLLSLLEMEHKTGYLLLVRDDETALLGLRQGRVVKADVRPAELVGRHKVLHVLDWSEGRFEFVAQEVGAGDEVDMSSTHLLLEHARLVDERAVAARKAAAAPTDGRRRQS